MDYDSDIFLNDFLTIFKMHELITNNLLLAIDLKIYYSERDLEEEYVSFHSIEWFSHKHFADNH